MQPVIYDVAVSIDGYIAGPDADISKFPHDGPIVDAYLARLATYACAIMGRATYEFGYRFGLAPGRNPYPHMRTIVFSDTLTVPPDAEIETPGRATRARIAAIRQSAAGPVYLCGGGAFAGWMASEGLIDVLRLKRPPILLGGGTRLFGEAGTAPAARLTHAELAADGALFQELSLAA